jgi:small subunit ribosomal protein S1
VRVLRVDPGERKIGLSRRKVGRDEEGAVTEETEAGMEDAAAKPLRELRGGTGTGGNLINMPDAAPKEQGETASGTGPK